MSLISLTEVALAYGGPPLLDHVSFAIEKGERIALLGRNGTGKTTLMRLMNGDFGPDSGQVTRQRGLRTALLPQDVPQDIVAEVFDVVALGLGERGDLLSRYHHATHELHQAETPELLRRISALQAELDRTSAWETDHQVSRMIGQLGLDPQARFENLSGGARRRVFLARALVSAPDILFLDEPTNHLDIPSILWLETLLTGYRGTVFYVSHDRQFMARTATRIMELDRGRMSSWTSDYRTFLKNRAIELQIEAARVHKFEKKLSVEEEWILKGVEARRCRNEGRVKALQGLRQDKAAARSQAGRVRLRLQDADTSGHLVIKASRVGHWFDDSRVLIKDFSLNIMRGDRIGLIGPNGCGKSTLLQILLGKLTPAKGTVRQGTDLQIAYFDQMREQIDGEKSVMENVAGPSETVMINGKPRHIIGYLQDFLFTPDRARSPARILSGGEKNRLLLARLFTRPANLLVLDEPTNDLDIETLEMLEEFLLEYPGTLILVSHDREFINNVVTSTLVMEEGGEIGEYPGGYDDQLAQHASTKPAEDSDQVKDNAGGMKSREKPRFKAGTVFSSRMARELERLPARIEQLEQDQELLCARLADPELYRGPAEEISRLKARAQAVAFDLAESYRRWEELEGSRQDTVND